MSLYFAYGSNLDEKQMKRRCPNSKFVCVSVLKNYKLIFDIYAPERKCGCADVVKDNNSEVWGVVYDLSDGDMLLLDKYEGHPNDYKRFSTKVYDVTGKEIDVECYEVVNKSEKHIPPSVDYVNIIINAADKYNFPKNYKDYISSVETIK